MRLHARSVLFAALGLAAAGTASAQVPVVQTTVIVTAQKEPADAQKLPVSVTAVNKDTIEKAGVVTPSDAAAYAPNVFFNEFTARKLSNARFRGIGSSPANPGITTYVDGVPQLNSNSSSFDLLGVEQIEFVRGGQSALFGRNALGGVINITSVRPSLAKWNGALTVPFGSESERGVEFGVNGPINDKLGVGVVFSRNQRDGFTINDQTGNDLAARKGTFFKAQMLWTPTTAWEARVLVTSERARDGDFALSDLQGLRDNPFHTMRDFEGRTDRDIMATTILTRYQGARVNLSTTTGVVNWKTRDITDLDYSPFAAVTRDNTEEDRQITQEVRLANAAAMPIKLTNSVTMRWQAGVFFFTQNFDQAAINSFSPFILSPQINFPVSQSSPAAALDDTGLGVFGHAALSLGSRVDATIGLRADRETKKADLRTAFQPAISPDIVVQEERTFSDVSPQFSVSFRAADNRMAYVSAGRSFKAGGFNPVAIPGSEGYEQERAWHVEGGLKSTWAGGRVTANAAVFSINWTDLQLNLPIPGGGPQFYIANVGNATSRGVEFELNARATDRVEVFGVFGYTRARFSDGNPVGGVELGGNKLPNTPSFTATFGTQISQPIRGGSEVYGRAEVVSTGAFEYDDRNTARQDAYTLTNFRAGWMRGHISVEAWIRNAFDTHYIPLAFAFPGGSASGFLGENGKPRTWGIRLGVGF